jgi:hypothetical protein
MTAGFSTRRMQRFACGRWPLAVAIAAWLAGCAAPPPVSAPAPTGVRHAYVVLADDGRPVARAITMDAACPSIAFDGVAQPMQVRAAPAVIPARDVPPMFGPTKPAAFPVLTCESAIPPGVARAVVAGHALPLPKAHPQRIVVLGDTGCRMAVYGNQFQDCGDPVAWPFRAVAAAAAATAPDLVIHVGDYHYRESACPPGNGGCKGSPWGYGWDVWEADFFAPAERLLAAAPWIVVRGNHESCGRAGVGWWRFLDPRPPAPHQDCVDPADDTIGDYSEPYAVSLGTGADADTQFLVFDSSRVGIEPLQPDQFMYRTYRAQFERAFDAASRRPYSFITFHHPVLGFAANRGQPDAPYPGNAGLLSVLTALNKDTLFPPGVQAVLSGHNHTLEIVSFATAHPPQVISGNGGDWVDAHLPSPFPQGLAPAPGAVVESLVSGITFGFMTMEREGARWKLTAFDTRGATMTTCTLAAKKIACVPAAGF